MMVMRLCAKAFPSRAIPSDKLLSKLHLRLRETGSFDKKPNAERPKSETTSEAEENDLRIAEENQNSNTRRKGAELNINGLEDFMRTAAVAVSYPMGTSSSSSGY
ncbi:hypothetical protein Trydic_g870 [Trypoxylus dichotomus]